LVSGRRRIVNRRRLRQLESNIQPRIDGWDLVLAFSLVYATAGYGLWRLVRFVIVRAFTLLLFAVSEIGAAWRAELRR
jgi:hypothetical protein